MGISGRLEENKMFCPFINEDCNYDCVFNNGCFGENDKSNCDLAEAVNTIYSLKITQTEVNNEILSKLQKIEHNTSIDQTESHYIKNILEDIILKNQN